jgi:cellulose synthase/poly-beta-1,6-N-acetylglucosamine synthase-like glycosyltransferase
MLRGLPRLWHSLFTSVRVSCLSLYLVYVFFFLMLFLPEFVFFIGSVTGSLASEEELTAGVRSKWLEGGD